MDSLRTHVEPQNILVSGLPPECSTIKIWRIRNKSWLLSLKLQHIIKIHNACLCSQLLRWLGGRDMEDPWTVGPSVSSCIYCKCRVIWSQISFLMRYIYVTKRYHDLLCSYFAYSIVCLETLLSMTMLKRTTLTIVIRTFSSRFCQGTMNLIHHTGMTSPILVKDNQTADWNVLCADVMVNTDNAFKIRYRKHKVTVGIIFLWFTAKTLVASLMEVDQDQRLTAQEAIAHEW